MLNNLLEINECTFPGTIMTWERCIRISEMREEKRQLCEQIKVC